MEVVVSLVDRVTGDNVLNLKGLAPFSFLFVQSSYTIMGRRLLRDKNKITGHSYIDSPV